MSVRQAMQARLQKLAARKAQLQGDIGRINAEQAAITALEAGLNPADENRLQEMEDRGLIKVTE